MARSAVFLVSLSRASAAPVSINYATEPGTAVAPSDFTSVSGTMTFQAGQTVMQVAVPVRDDIQGATEENFKLRLSNPVGVSLKNDFATCVLPGTAVNSQPVLSVSNVTIASAT